MEARVFKKSRGAVERGIEGFFGRGGATVFQSFFLFFFFG